MKFKRHLISVPNSIIVPVFGNGAAGRLRDEDLVAFNALNDVYRFRSESLMFIINDLPSDHSSYYEGKASARLENLLKMKELSICFVDRIDVNNWFQKKQLRMKLLNNLTSRNPSIHEKNGEIALPVDKIRQLTEEMRKKQDDFEKKTSRTRKTSQTVQ